LHRFEHVDRCSSLFSVKLKVAGVPVPVAAKKA
jgi:hypothetical protein